MLWETSSFFLLFRNKERSKFARNSHSSSYLGNLLLNSSLCQLYCSDGFVKSGGDTDAMNRFLFSYYEQATQDYA